MSLEPRSCCGATVRVFGGLIEPMDEGIHKPGCWHQGFNDGYGGESPATHDEPYWDGWLTGLTTVEIEEEQAEI